MEKFITITGWTMVSLIALSLVVLIIPMTMYLCFGLEDMRLVIFGVVCAVVTSVVAAIYFASVTVDNIRASWKNDEEFEYLDEDEEYDAV